MPLPGMHHKLKALPPFEVVAYRTYSNCASLSTTTHNVVVTAFTDESARKNCRNT